MCFQRSDRTTDDISWCMVLLVPNLPSVRHPKLPKAPSTVSAMVNFQFVQIVKYLLNISEFFKNYVLQIMYKINGWKIPKKLQYQEIKPFSQPMFRLLYVKRVIVFIRILALKFHTSFSDIAVGHPELYRKEIYTRYDSNRSANRYLLIVKLSAWKCFCYLYDNWQYLPRQHKISLR